MALIGHQGFDFVDIPKVVLVRKGHVRNALPMCRAIQRFARLRIALISQFAVTVDGVVTALLQFRGDSGLACPGNAFDQIVPDTHFALVR